jgi:hypothetical protein
LLSVWSGGVWNFIPNKMKNSSRKVSFLTRI